MPEPIHAIDYLAKPSRVPAICVLYGGDWLLKLLVRNQISAELYGARSQDAPYVSFSGENATWRDISDELATISLFGEKRRLVIVDEADEFVSDHRTQLEAYVERPAATGVLVLEMAAWPATTRIYKSVAASGIAIQCDPPYRLVGKRKVIDETKLIEWLSRRSVEQHKMELPYPAARQLLDLVEPNLGLLDQELAKLALLLDGDRKVTPQLVCDVVGGWRVKTTWELLEAAAEGNAADALEQLDRLLASGEAIQGLFGAFSWSLRRFADATRIIERAERNGERADLRGALRQAGFRTWPADAIDVAERQLRQIGRQRAGQLHRWLLAADLSLKGSHSAPDRARLVLETLIVQLSKKARPAARGAVVRS